MTTRYAVGLEYDGTHYAGWQRQPFFAATIQEQLERALSQVAAHAVETTCAGRTDAGVHATAQVIHFDTGAIRSDFAWLAGANRYLPADIRLQDPANATLALYIILAADKSQAELFGADHAESLILDSVKGGYASADGKTRLLNTQNGWSIRK